MLCIKFALLQHATKYPNSRIATLCYMYNYPLILLWKVKLQHQIETNDNFHLNFTFPENIYFQDFASLSTTVLMAYTLYILGKIPELNIN